MLAPVIPIMFTGKFEVVMRNVECSQFCVKLTIRFYQQIVFSAIKSQRRQRFFVLLEPINNAQFVFAVVCGVLCLWLFNKQLQLRIMRDG